MSSFSRMPVRTVSARLLIIDSWMRTETSAGRVNSGGAEGAANCDSRASRAVDLQGGGERVEAQAAGKGTALVQRLSRLGLELLVGLLDAKDRPGHRPGRRAGHAACWLAMASAWPNCLPARRQAIFSTNLRPLIDTMLLIVVWASAAACGRMGVQARFVQPEPLVGSQASLAGRVDADRPVAADVVAVVDRFQQGIEGGERGIGRQRGLGLAHGTARAVNHGPQDHVVDRRHVVDGPAHAHVRATRRQSGHENSAGRTDCESPGPVPALAGRFPAKGDGRRSSGFRRSSGGAPSDLICCVELIDLTLERRFQVGIANQAGHGEIVSQRGSQIRKPLQFQPFIARSQLLVNIAENGIVGLGLLQFALERVPGEIFFPAVGRSPSGGKPLIQIGGRGLDLGQCVLDVGLGQGAELRGGDRPASSHRGGSSAVLPKQDFGLPG